MNRRLWMAQSAGTMAWWGGWAMGVQPGLSQERERILKDWLGLLGPFPAKAPPLDPETVSTSETDLDGILLEKVRFRSEPDDWIPGWVLIPQGRRKGPPGTGILCIHPTTSGAGKDLVVGRSGRKPGTPYDPSLAGRAYGLELARRGHVVLCIDLLTDGERVFPGVGPYDSRPFYHKHPDWSMVGKNAWDAQRSIDYLLTRAEVDSNRIACLGHSLGGHSSLFAAAFDPRIRVTIANGGVLGWMRPQDHWARAGGFEPPPKPGEKPVPGVGRYTYIKGFAPYLKDPGKTPPVDFDDLMIAIAPRPLLVMESEKEFADYGFPAKEKRVLEAYRPNRPKNNAPDYPPFLTRSYPGPHDFPEAARQFAWKWLETWI